MSVEYLKGEYGDQQWAELAIFRWRRGGVQTRPQGLVIRDASHNAGGAPALVRGREAARRAHPERPVSEAARTNSGMPPLRRITPSSAPSLSLLPDTVFPYPADIYERYYPCHPGRPPAGHGVSERL